MKHLIGMLLFITSVGLIFIILAFKPSPDTYFLFQHRILNVTEPVLTTKLLTVTNESRLPTTIPNVPFQVTVTESIGHNMSTTLPNNDVKFEPVKYIPVSKLSIAKTSSLSKSLNVISNVAIPIRGERNIFFIESSCAMGDMKKTVLKTPRQGCAIESAALTNPNATIYFLNTCGEVEFNESHPTDGTFVKEVFHYPNVKSLHIKLESFFSDTPLSEWITKNDLKKSSYPVEHSSDILRLVTLWKFGGVYLDLDFVVLRSLKDLKQDFTAIENDSSFANSVLGFSANGIGHEVADMCLKEVLTKFDGQQWGYNGPNLINRVMSKLCNGETVKNMTPEKCKGFTVYDPTVFFPFYYTSWRVMFDEGNSGSTIANILKNGTYAVHAWNKMSHIEPIKVGSKQPYALLASHFCPRVYSTVKKTF